MRNSGKPTLVWPTGLRVSKITVPKSAGRVVLATAWLLPTEEDNKWTIQATNSFCFCRTPVLIENEAKLRKRVAAVDAIPLPPKALAALEAGAVIGCAYFEDDGSVTVDDVTYHPPEEWPEEKGDHGFMVNPGQFPAMEKLEPTQLKTAIYEIGFNAKILHNLARAMGTETVRCTFDTETTLRAFYVSPIGAGRDEAKGMLMPIRLNV